MEYIVAQMNLSTTQVIFSGETNDVYICRDMNSPVEMYYTLVMMKKHNIARKLIELFEQYEQEQRILLQTFSYQDCFGFVFPYRSERPLEQFYMGSSYDLVTCEKICINLIMECMMIKLPYSVLFLMLKQKLIHLEKDFSTYFTYTIDFSEFDETAGERECAVSCADIVRTLLEPFAADKAFSYILLNRKISKDSYARFTDLYKDVHLAAVPEKKKGIIKKLKAWLRRNQDRLFRFFLVICIVGGIIALIMLISQLIMGDIPLLRLIFNPFKEIGTESMLQ